MERPPCFLCRVGVEPAQLVASCSAQEASGTPWSLLAYTSALPVMQVLVRQAAMDMAARERARGDHAVMALDGFSR